MGAAQRWGCSCWPMLLLGTLLGCCETHKQTHKQTHEHTQNTCHRSQVAERYRKKIELVVRKPDRGGEPPPAAVPCAFCRLPGAETELQCAGCRGILPFDIATGVWGACVLVCVYPTCILLRLCASSRLTAPTRLMLYAFT